MRCVDNQKKKKKGIRKRMPLVLAVLISATLGNQPDIISLQYYAHIMQYVTIFNKIYNVI